uniref:Uncharacterized protein n=1 Tax=Loxodonta africana TaxID=9785 RepID=G3U9L9_LOXAF
DHDAEYTWTLRFSPSPVKSAEGSCAPDSPPPATLGPAATFTPPRALERGPRSPASPRSLRPPAPPVPRPWGARVPSGSPWSLNDTISGTLGHLGHIAATLGPLRDQLLTLNQHVEQLRGSFDQTVSLAVGFILGNASAERGVL